MKYSLYNLLLLVTMATTHVACMLPPDGDTQTGEKHGYCSGYDCPIQVDMYTYFQRANYLSCTGTTVSIDHLPYNGNESLVRVDSIRNIPIDLGEFHNDRNGSENTNHEDGSQGTYHKQNFYVSLWSKAQTMKLERGSNRVRYQYVTCGAKDSRNQCTRWDIQEQGVRLINARERAVEDLSCDMVPDCSSGKAVYKACSRHTALEKPKTLWSDW